MDFDVAFDWDDAKAVSNVRKHRVSFQMALQVFLDPFRLELKDERFPYDEHRYNVIGSIAGRLFHVSYTVRRTDDDGDLYWIISARPAVPKERRRYHDGP